MNDFWPAAGAYERFMGRWSRRLADEFIRWLGPDAGLAWLDVGCGTGALTSAVCALADPASVVACDPTPAFVEHARNTIADRRVAVVVAGDGDLPDRPGGIDCVVSGLVLNFLPDPAQSLRTMRARTRPGGCVAAYVWDYADRMEFLRRFWDEAAALDPVAGDLTEGSRYSMCRPDALEPLFRSAGLVDPRSGAIEIRTRFASFEDYWRPFLGGTGPAAAYVSSLDEAKREALRERLERRLGGGPDGAIDLPARAWAVRGAVPPA